MWANCTSELTVRVCPSRRSRKILNREPSSHSDGKGVWPTPIWKIKDPLTANDGRWAFGSLRNVPLLKARERVAEARQKLAEVPTSRPALWVEKQAFTAPS
jgi:hypothetical protein